MTLDEVRINIDRIDRQMKALFQERMGLADQVAQVKAQTGDTILKPDREAAMLTRLTGDMKPEIKEEYTSFLKRMIEISRKYQYGRTLEMRNCLGLIWKTEDPDPKALCVVKSEQYICDFLQMENVQAVDDFEAAGNLIARGAVEGGIGILEEVGVSTSQPIQSLLVDKNLYINRCRVINDKGRKKKVCMFTPDLIVRPEHNRIKIMFACPNRSGSLASILSMIADYHVNLTEIHSYPNQKKEWNYEFYVEFTGNLLEKEMQALIFQLSCETEHFKLLGSYACNGDFEK